MRTHNNDRELRLISQQAEQWICDLRDAGQDKEAEFTRWLKRSPRHVAEFLLATVRWREVCEASQTDSTDLDALTAEALASETRANVVRLNASSVTELEEPSLESAGAIGVHRRLRPGARWAVAASCLLAILATAWVGWRVHTGPTYATAIGEQRTLQLADGSLLQLNTHSRVQVHFTAKFRDVRLLEGEAFFSVQHDPSRPFRVESGGALVQAVGTQFNVYRGSGGQTQVAVLEGRVRIVERAAERDQAALPLLHAGEQISIAPGRPVIKQKGDDVTDAVAWRQRKLVFNGKRLEDVATEFNRYNQRRIVVTDDAARNKLLSGTFNADDPDSLMLFLSRLNDLTVQRADDGFVIGDR
jgi:transmembrane sensor